MQPIDEIKNQLHFKEKEGGGLAPRRQGPPTPQMLWLLNGKLQEIFRGDNSKRISLLRWLWGVESSKELTFSQVAVTLDWLIDKELSQWEVKLDGTKTIIHVVRKEAENACQAIITKYCEERGQIKLL